jgi:hypothetical protein
VSIYEAIAAYLDAWDDMRKAYYERKGYKWPSPEHLVLHDTDWLKVVMEGGYRRVEAFIDRKTGDIYPAVSWDKAASQPSGNVFSVQHGMEAMDDSIFPGPMVPVRTSVIKQIKHGMIVLDNGDVLPKGTFEVSEWQAILRYNDDQEKP